MGGKGAKRKGGHMTMKKIAWKILALPMAIVLGLAVQIIGIVPFGMLMQRNVVVRPDIPWATAFEVVLLIALFTYLSGHFWPKGLSETRRDYLRMNPVAGPLLGHVIFTAFTYGLAIIALSIASYLLLPLPEEAGAMFFALQDTPKTTHIVLLATTLIATGFIEETAYRGYLQRPLEHAYGPAVAILVAAIAFGLSHNLPTYWLPVFVFASLGWGVMARFANSNWPGIFTHIFVDGCFFYWFFKNPDDLRMLLASDVLHDGPTKTFYIAAGAAIVLGLVSIFNFIRLGRMKRALEG